MFKLAVILIIVINFMKRNFKKTFFEAKEAFSVINSREKLLTTELRMLLSVSLLNSTKIGKIDESRISESTYGIITPVKSETKFRNPVSEELIYFLHAGIISNGNPTWFSHCIVTAKDTF